MTVPAAGCKVGHLQLTASRWLAVSCRARGTWCTSHNVPARLPTRPGRPPLPAATCRRRAAAVHHGEAEQQQQQQQQQGQAAALSLGAGFRHMHAAADAAMAAVLLASSSSALLWAPAALAAEGGVAYNPAGGSDTLKTVAGAAYIGLVIFYFVRLFTKRAKNATTQRISSVADAAAYRGGDVDSDDEEDEEQRAKRQQEEEVTPLQSVIAAAQAGAICYLLFLASSTVDTFFEGQPLPEQYTARNIALLVQTVCRGAVYLSAFIFGANTLGLSALTLQLLLFPESRKDDGARRSRAAKLPRVSVTDDIFALRKAFKEAERMGQVQAEREIKKSQQSRDDN